MDMRTTEITYTVNPSRRNRLRSPLTQKVQLEGSKLVLYVLINRQWRRVREILDFNE